MKPPIVPDDEQTVPLTVTLLNSAFPRLLIHQPDAHPEPDQLPLIEPAEFMTRFPDERQAELKFQPARIPQKLEPVPLSTVARNIWERPLLVIEIPINVPHHPAANNKQFPIDIVPQLELV